jgi:cysteine-rich repeat protein
MGGFNTDREHDMRTLTLALLLSLAACNTGTDAVSPGEDAAADIGFLWDATADATAPLDQDEPDLAAPDTAMDMAALDGAGDVGSACEPGEGCFLDPCEDNSDCLSGWCVQHMAEDVCTQTCSEECPPGWSCRQVGASDPDVVFICVSDLANLCRPCAATADCGSLGGAQDVCVSYGAETGAFCGGACEDDADCPGGYTCADVETIDGLATRQCVNDLGDCPCTDSAVALVLWTPCEAANDVGVCPGKRVCGEEGLSVCDAPPPTAELCNGVDDDCDGAIDEDTCDDDNPCTEDACLGEGGCEHVALDGVECLDGDPCTAADHCVAGICLGDPVLCDDQNPCTDDSCTETGGCDHAPNVVDCDDGDPCTVADECGDGACAGTPVACDCATDADCGPLEDGDLCNGTLVCDTASLPFQCVVDPGTLVDCPAPEGSDAPCLVATCDGETGACGFAAGADSTPCDDGDPCTIGDACLEGSCVSGSAANCNDGNPCTDDTCAEGVGCVHVPNDLACEDGNICTVGDVCVDGQCGSGGSIACDDGNVCTDDACDPATGCVFTANLAPCDDGNACTTGEACAAGSCAGGVAVDCDDGAVCTDDLCAPATGCLNPPNTAPCDDGDLCTVGDVCQDGACAGAAVICDDGNVCTDDSCAPLTGCLFTPNADPCDDQNACTAGDICAAGACTPGAPYPCDDGELCTDDSCDPATGCVYTLNESPCDDGDLCTLGDVCAFGTCAAGAAMDCDDGNVCTDDSCDPDFGCLHGNNAAPCDDGNTCTTGDACANGSCLGLGSTDCDDDNPCTKDICQPGGGCDNVPIAGACDDGDPCTLNDACDAGVCTAGVPKPCDDANPCTDDLCDADGTCVHAPNTAPCDDGNACTTGDSCQDGACTFEDVVICDDGELCTTDYCSPVTGCQTVNNTLPCNDGDACTTVDVCGGGVCGGSGAPICDDGNPCTDDGCLPQTGCVFTHNTASCDDGNACTTVDVCVAGDCSGAVAPDCDDDDVCTTDSCDPTDGCVHALNTAPCDDDDACTTVDTCNLGTCVGASPLSCDDGDHCTTDTCDPELGCVFTAITPCCGNGITEGPGETCDDGGLQSGDGCDSACQVENTTCFQDWLVGTPCNGVDYGNGCVPSDTGYHFKGIYSGYACWWHQKNQAWNTTTATNYYSLALHFEVTPGVGKVSWCHNKYSTPTPDSYSSNSGYFSASQVGAWGWCAESDPDSVGFVCIPTEGTPACN